MLVKTFAIKSLVVQDTIMVLSLGIVVFFLLRALAKKNIKHGIVFVIWILIILWFFNSPFFGFSQVTVSPDGIQLKYGLLSFRDTVVPIDSRWEIETSLTGLRKMKRVYTIRIGDRRSMRVRWKGGYELLTKIGKAIEEARQRP